MPTRNQKTVPEWYDALIDELEAWIEVNHDERHRRMDELRKDLEKQEKQQKSSERR